LPEASPICATWPTAAAARRCRRAARKRAPLRRSPAIASGVCRNASASAGCYRRGAANSERRADRAPRRPAHASRRGVHLRSSAGDVMFEQILYAVDDGVATITLNRPEKLNAFTNTMRLELIAAFDRVDADDTVRAVIVTGAGRAFCAGADLSSGGQTFDYEARGAIAAGERRRDGGGTVALRIFQCRKAVIAAVNGPAVGVGATMQL